MVTHITHNMTRIGDIQYTNSQWVLWSTLVPLQLYTTGEDKVNQDKSRVRADRI